MKSNRERNNFQNKYQTIILFKKIYKIKLNLKMNLLKPTNIKKQIIGSANDKKYATKSLIIQ